VLAAWKEAGSRIRQDMGHALTFCTTEVDSKGHAHKNSRLFLCAIYSDDRMHAHSCADKLKVHQADEKLCMHIWRAAMLGPSVRKAIGSTSIADPAGTT
jgi:hypothetical protein